MPGRFNYATEHDNFFYQSIAFRTNQLVVRRTPLAESRRKNDLVGLLRQQLLQILLPDGCPGVRTVTVGLVGRRN